MDYRSVIKVNLTGLKAPKTQQKNISEYSQHTLLHIYTVSVCNLTELQRVNYAHIYSNLRGHFSLFTVNTHATEITLQLCTWMTWRRWDIVDEWMTSSTTPHLPQTTTLRWCFRARLCVCASESVLTLFDFFCCSVDENVERPHHAGDGDDVEGDRTHDLPPLARRHL